jgi:pimeloyl-ACP methyl ester carboxylesterase
MNFDTAPRIAETSDGRAVGYRRVGEGPPVAMLHASPRSAAAMLPLAMRLAENFTVFAFDTPGYGYSAPLSSERPDAFNYGDALVGAFDALGLTRVPIYGSHTGAAIAVAAAIDHPDRVSALALDGYAIFTPTEQADYATTYLAPIRPDWEGAWLAWLWSRVKDQFTFFPWYQRAQSARLPRALAPLAFRQNVIVDFLAAGDNYCAPYGAAFRFPGAAALRRVSVPTIVMARSDDLLFKDLDALADNPPNVSVRRVPAEDEAHATAVRAALSVGATGSAPAVPKGRRRTAATSGGMLDVIRVAGGTIAVTQFGATSGQPLILLSDVPGSAKGSAALAQALGRDGPVHAIDLPGFGASSLPSARSASDIARAVREALAIVGVDHAEIVACGASASVGCALADLGRVVLIDPVPDGARAGLLEAFTDVAPREDGSHLLGAWHQLRDDTLWQPWFQRDPAHARNVGTDPDVARLQAVLTDWMRGGLAGKATLAAVLAEPLEGRVPAGACAIVVAEHPRAAQSSAFARTIATSDGLRERVEAIRTALATRF